MLNALSWFWAETKGNIIATPACSVIAVALGGKWLKAFKRENTHRTHLVEETWHLAHTGEVHPRAQERITNGGV